MHNSIPKVINYCWFGGAPLGELERKCIESWRRYLPGYEIVCWDESNFNIACCSYVKEAYDAQKWAFVSDYVRFKVLYDNGGIYLDTDVELIRQVDDLVSQGPFMGFETDFSEGISFPCVNTGLGFALSKHDPICGEVLASYHSDHFDPCLGAGEQITVVDRVTEILYRNGLSDIEGIQNVSGITIYPSEYFNPKDFYSGELKLTENTRSIHHFGMSWFSEEEQFEKKIASGLYNIGVKGLIAGKISAAIAIVRYLDFNRLFHAFRKRL